MNKRQNKKLWKRDSKKISKQLDDLLIYIRKKFKPIDKLDKQL